MKKPPTFQGLSLINNKQKQISNYTNSAKIA